RRRLRVAGWPRESGYLPGARGVSERIHGQLLHQLRQRFDSFTRIMGKKATLVNIGGEGSPRWKIVEEKGTYEDNPYIKRAEKYVTLPGEDRVPPTYISDNVL